MILNQYPFFEMASMVELPYLTNREERYHYFIKMDSKNIYILLFQETGAFNATFRLARELKKQGYTVVYIVDGEFEAYVASHQFTTFTVDLQFREEEKIFGKTADRWQRLKEYADTDLTQIREIAQRGASGDIVLLDQIVWWLGVPFIEREIPVLGLNTTLASAWNYSTPPVFLNTLPQPGRSQMVRYLQSLWDWLKLFCFAYPNRVNVPAYELMLGYIARSPHHLRKRMVERHGLKVSWGEYGYRLKIPEIVLSPREFDFPQAPDSPSRCYVGASVDPNRNDELHPLGKASEGRGTQPFESDLSFIDSQKQLIYCSLGTYGHLLCEERIEFYSAVMEAMRHFTDCQLLIQISKSEDVERSRPPLPNVRILTWAPQLELLSRASLFITHGGFSSVREAIYYGVPMLVFPFLNDQFGNSARIVFHQLGLRGDIKQITVQRLVELIKQMFSTPLYRQRAKKMQTIFLEQENCDRGARFILEFMEK